MLNVIQGYLDDARPPPDKWKGEDLALGYGHAVFLLAVMMANESKVVPPAALTWVKIVLESKDMNARLMLDGIVRFLGHDQGDLVYDDYCGPNRLENRLASLLFGLAQMWPSFDHGLEIALDVATRD